MRGACAAARTMSRRAQNRTRVPTVYNAQQRGGAYNV